MKTIRIFLASSSELKAERDAFEQNISRENKRWKTKGIEFDLVHWEDHDDAAAPDGKQADYNRSIATCDILVVMYWTKVGRYTREEFETGWEHFQTTGRPIIYVYEKTAPFRPKEDDAASLFDFRNRLREIGHYPTQAEDADEMLLHFNRQLADRYDRRSGHPDGVKIPQALTSYAPIDPATECIGREADLQRLKDALARTSRTVIVNGLGGMGKTTLAKAWFQSVKDQYDHWAWIEVSGEAGQTHALGVVEAIAFHPHLAENLGLSFEEKEEPLARYRKVMNALRRLEGRGLLVIDNAGSDMEAADIRGELPQPPRWQVLLTNRSELKGYDHVSLGHLEPPYAMALFRQYYTEPCTDDEVQTLLKELGYHTLSIELVAKTLQEHFGTLSIATMTEKLRRRQLDDPDLQRRISLQHSKEETEVYTHLLVTFQCVGLSEAEQLLLARMAALPPDGAYTAGELEEWLQPTAGRKTLHEALSRLARQGWLSQSQDNRFGLHRMIQQAVLYQLRPSMTELGVLVETFTQKLSFDIGTNFTLLFPWIPYAEQVLAVLPEEEREQVAVGKLLNNLGEVCRNLGDYARARDLLEASLSSALKN